MSATIAALTAIQVIALTIFGEAANQPYPIKRAVASVIWNRAGGDPDKLREVCLKPKQFSCWNSGQIIRVPNDAPSRTVYSDCTALAIELTRATRFIPNTTADHFHSSWMDPEPYWAQAMTRLGRAVDGQMGDLVFYTANR